MSAALELTPTTLERIRQDLVGLKMPRALEALDAIVRRLEQGEISGLCRKPFVSEFQLILPGLKHGGWRV
jgi:hypothetical protein